LPVLSKLAAQRRELMERKMGHIPMWAMGALVVAVLFDLPAFWVALSVIGAGVLTALLGV
jgi:dolichol kinase